MMFDAELFYVPLLHIFLKIFDPVDKDINSNLHGMIIFTASKRLQDGVESRAEFCRDRASFQAASLAPTRALS